MSKLSKFKKPRLDLLKQHVELRPMVGCEELMQNEKCIREIMQANNVQIEEDIIALFGPSVSRYEVTPASGIKISKIKSLADDIAFSLGKTGVRAFTTDQSLAFEIPNKERSLVPLKNLLSDKAFKKSEAELPLAIGMKPFYETSVIDLVDAPHILVAGATKQGKSVCLQTMVASLLFSKRPDEVKFVFIDPKMVDFPEYGALLNHYLCVLPNASNEEEERSSAIVTTAQDAANVLGGLCAEMEGRYNTLMQAKVSNVREYNRQAESKLPYIVCVIDEYADLTVTFGAKKESKELSKRITASIIRLAQSGRATGIHLILATQRPSRDVITGLIKANFPTRIAFRTSSRIDSMIILDMPGAEKLIGEGDMLLSQGMNLERIQGGYISKEEMSAIVDYIGAQKGHQKSFSSPHYLPIPREDAIGIDSTVPMLDEQFVIAAEFVVSRQRASISDLQKHLCIGYAKAGRLIDQLEAAGIIGPETPRKVLVADEELEAYLRNLQAKG